MDQTGLPFIMDDGKTYANKGSDDVSCLSGQSGLEKRQATAIQFNSKKIFSKTQMILHSFKLQTIITIIVTYTE